MVAWPPALRRPRPSLLWWQLSIFLAKSFALLGNILTKRYAVPDAPYMPDRRAAHLAAALRASSCYLEYGAGGSTVLAARLGVADIVSVESDRAWLQRVEETLFANGAEWQQASAFRRHRADTRTGLSARRRAPEVLPQLSARTLAILRRSQSRAGSGAGGRTFPACLHVGRPATRATRLPHPARRLQVARGLSSHRALHAPRGDDRQHGRIQGSRKSSRWQTSTRPWKPRRTIRGEGVPLSRRLQAFPAHESARCRENSAL